MSVADQIKQNLEENLDVTHLEIINQSHLHAGHSGDDGTGESHFHIVIHAHDFAGQSRIKQHKMVHAALGQGLMTRIHAIGIDAKIPNS